MANDNGIEVGDRVVHKRDPSLTGIVQHVDDGYEIFGATTCEVEWDDDLGVRDIQWTNKLDIIP